MKLENPQVSQAFQLDNVHFFSTFYLVFINRFVRAPPTATAKGLAKGDERCLWFVADPALARSTEWRQSMAEAVAGMVKTTTNSLTWLSSVSGGN